MRRKSRKQKQEQQQQQQMKNKTFRTQEAASKKYELNNNLK